MDFEFKTKEDEFMTLMRGVLMAVGVYGVLSVSTLTSFDPNIAFGILMCGVVFSMIYAHIKDRNYRKKNGLQFSKLKLNYSDGTSEEMNMFEPPQDGLFVDKVVHAGNKGLSVSVKIIK
ncbi:hypothetical protein [Methanococcus maripaludis]|uniref:Uncharacterized protein n=1 Tax=Methanococcus maripaludis TaxID=39152 RepID=A0A7J9PHH0_METMI|nr:hypothetical protein [Methanococcus maripaludis]MBA2852979.1 hypothetical protein [Methanococcus maripaludis]MBA2860969.1 hypothetical protein [Methanococcus maripaludis]